MAAPLLALDAPSLYYRAYFGVPESITAPDGTPVNAVRGFLDALSTLIRGRAPDRVVCALDFDWRPAWRVALLPSYKAHRVVDEELNAEATPDTLSPQVPILLDILAALGVPAIGSAGFEADDVLGTLAARGPAPVEVVTGDRDLFQLIDDGVSVLYVGRGVANLEVLDDAAVRARYGVPAAAYADFAVLRGDPSDGLPGVAGVGEKTAAKLITAYGDLDGLLAHVHEQPKGLQAKLLAATDYLKVAPAVVRVATDVELPEFDATLPKEPVDPEGLAALAETWGVTGAVGRLTTAMARN
ncbi:5'-3' exonuclease [Longispora fulva]|uniref:5'-3' exonuclease n=1 Tax=Longispora fulva TaxID=619741 RepID=A0A8J7KKZ0_9ACTN|nr:5'-3' exonuclease [Longispora fulva]MBG6137331.1 5'-3' exonuclease [Longispora fulva]GIG61315.1 5'-3' exonuclease [Longispora fulva]